ncbi:hypothetical protein [Streptomyces sp. NBC_01304]|nr:hypothetical protein OG430_48805 [Streptomyces sp. NBC_01304]
MYAATVANITGPDQAEPGGDHATVAEAPGPGRPGGKAQAMSR